jgi:hypothetical protein
MWHNLDEKYAVDKLGRVKSYKWGKDRILKPGKTPKGYLRVVLYVDGKKKRFSVHRLVAEAFIPNPQNLPQVLHRDDNPENNRVENLFWGTNKENQDDCHKKGRHIKPKRRVTNGKETFESTREAARQTGINQSNISNCCKGTYGYKTAGGFTWGYVS